MIDLLLAAPELRQEPDLVVAAPAQGARVLRRCVDAVDLLAAASADPRAHAVVSRSLPRLSADVVDRIGRERVLGLAEAESDEPALRALGIDVVIRLGDEAGTTMARLLAGCRPDAPAAAGVWPTGVPDAEGPDGPAQADSGRLVAVWGPAGAPGRTTVALGLAESLADGGQRVCLVDADTYAPSIALALGVVEESSGLVVACRHADAGSLSPVGLTALTRRIQPQWHLLGGLPSADRWPDLRAGALDRLWAACREAFDVTVVDVGFCVERDEAGAWSRQRNAAALTALGAADHVVAVADASARGAARLATAWPGVATALAGGTVTVVRNRAMGRDREWARAVAACGVRGAVHDVPADARRVARCAELGRTLGEGARRSPVRRSLGELARQVVSG